MDRISINRISTDEPPYAKIQIEIIPECGNGKMPIYKGTMTLEEFSKCITNIMYCEINTVIPKN